MITAIVVVTHQDYSLPTIDVLFVKTGRAIWNRVNLAEMEQDIAGFSRFITTEHSVTTQNQHFVGYLQETEDESTPKRCPFQVNVDQI